MTEVAAERPRDQEKTSRAKRLKALTHELHERLDASITLVSTFTSVEGYGRFLEMQWQFHRDVDPLYHDARLQDVIPGLLERRRLPLVELDLADLDLAPPPGRNSPLFGDHRPIDVPTALGWLYVAEGSNLGASLLRKQVAKIGLSDDFGARHLAPAADGPAEHWRSFVAALDAAPLDEEEDARAGAGARMAFTLVQSLADVHIL